MADRTAVLVTGSRDWTDYGPIRERLKLYPEGTILLHGDCGELLPLAQRASHYDWFKGADKIAAHVAEYELGFNIWRLPYFKDKGKGGGPIRNACLFDHLLVFQKYGFVCAVEAFPPPKPDGGTRGLIERIQAFNRRCEEVPSVSSSRVVGPIPLHVTEAA